MAIRFREGFSVRGISAERAAEELQRIYNENGKLISAEVVECARPKNSPLHSAFEWSDKKAAHEYRLNQARTLIRAVIIVSDDGKKSDPVYVHIPSQDPDAALRGGEYHPASVVVQHVDMFEQALAELERRVSSAMNAVESLRREAGKSSNPDRLAKVALAVRALEAASQVIGALH